jgi:histidinol phosphatase-like enzyme
VFPKTIDDWKWKNDAIVPKLKAMYADGYEIVIVSNQFYINSFFNMILKKI